MKLLNKINSPKDLKKLSIFKLNKYANEVREFLLKSNSKTGGHIGANLGTIDLTIAVHYVFESPEDSIIWDTGHQGYTQKLISGRKKLFETLNQFEGMNRFLTPRESVHDTIEASHAGTSLSFSLGAALSNRLKAKDAFSVAIIGDGSLCEGLALEALNHIGSERNLKLILILNDNGFAISPGIGAIHNYLSSKSKKNKSSETLFTSLGFQYFGPINGHNIKEMIEVFKKSKESKKIPIIHIKTNKGQGYKEALKHPNKMHFSFPFNLDSGKSIISPQISYDKIAANVIEQCMKKNKDIVTITPSTRYATGLDSVFKKYPDRCFDPGMEEQHAMALSAGFALKGMKPIIFYQSTFMQRAFDQIFHDISFMNLPVLILAIRSGFAGYDNPTHHGIYDLSYLRCIPNLKMYYIMNEKDIENLIRFTMSKKGPSLIMMPYGPINEDKRIKFIEVKDDSDKIIYPSKDIMIIALGNTLNKSIVIRDVLVKEGIKCGVACLRKIKPLNIDRWVSLFKTIRKVVTIEENVLEGGIGASFAALIKDYDLNTKLLRVGVPNVFAEAGSNEELNKLYSLDVDSIVSKIKNII